MPIRFRCVYCKQLMGIARRKAGAVVRCPNCKRQVAVPNPAEVSPEPSPPDPPLPVPPLAPAPQAGPNLFEQSVFGKEFEHEPEGISPEPKPLPAVHGGQIGTPSQEIEIDVEPLSDQGIFITPAKMALLGVAGVVLLGLAFFAGLLLGR